MSKVYGYTAAESSSRKVQLVAKYDKADKEEVGAAIGRMMYIKEIVDGTEFLAIGTISEVITINPSFNDINSLSSIAGRKEGQIWNRPGADVRRTDFNVQAVFSKDSEGKWQKSSAQLPSSASTGRDVMFLDEEIIKELTEDDVYPTVGYFRGMSETVQPLDIPDFGGNRGAVHTGLVGRSGSGKTFMGSMVLGASMKHENHAILVIDPQGQWSNENGMGFSPQNFAKSLGRDVKVLRISEDVRLPFDEELFTRMLIKMNVWKKGFRRMGSENLEAFSDAVVHRIMNRGVDAMNSDARIVLEDIFISIAESDFTMGRIYASAENRETLRRELLIRAGKPVINEDGEQEIITKEMIEDNDTAWKEILFYFEPLQNLFSKKNLAGTKRHALGGDTGFLSKIFQVRNERSEPAPYVVLDMSPSVHINAKNDILGGKDINVSMQKILDNADIKALMLMTVLGEMKAASEIAFSQSGGNLNTQIVFDEAWRFASENSQSKEINELSTMLEGFALDTRKFGIGWTYILQSPADLRSGIWKQLSYVYAGWGLVGGDVSRLEALTDDTAQVSLYRGFISPASTGTYPFMIMGSISPIIFTTAPTFINAFNSTEEFLEHNRNWINEIISKRGLPGVTADSLNKPLSHAPKIKAGSTPKAYSVGGSTLNAKTQSVIKKLEPEPEKNPNDPLGDMPF